MCSGERVEMRKLSSNPLCVSPEPDSTFTSWTASITSRGAGIGTPGPISSCRRTGLAIARPRDSLGQRDAQPTADRDRQVARVDRAVGVGEPPPQLGVAEVTRREHVAAVALGDRGPRRAAAKSSAAGRSGGGGTPRAARRCPDPTRRPRSRRSGSSAGTTSTGSRRPRAAVAADRSSDRLHSERGERNRRGEPGQALLVAQVGHEERAAAVPEAEVVDREHAQAERDLGADRVERDVERLLGDRRAR